MYSIDVTNGISNKHIARSVHNSPTMKVFVGERRQVRLYNTKRDAPFAISPNKPATDKYPPSTLSNNCGTSGSVILDIVLVFCIFRIF